MNKFLILILCLFLFGCDNPVKVQFKTDVLDNTCYVDAASYHAAYKAQNQLKPDYYVKILLIRWNNPIGKINSHVATVFIFNPDKNNDPSKRKLLIYDRELGTREIPMSLYGNAIGIARARYGYNQVKNAEFLE